MDFDIIAYALFGFSLSVSAAQLGGWLLTAQPRTILQAGRISAVCLAVGTPLALLWLVLTGRSTVAMMLAAFAMPVLIESARRWPGLFGTFSLFRRRVAANGRRRRGRQPAEPAGVGARRHHPRSRRALRVDAPALSRTDQARVRSLPGHKHYDAAAALRIMRACRSRKRRRCSGCRPRPAPTRYGRPAPDCRRSSLLKTAPRATSRRKSSEAADVLLGNLSAPRAETRSRQWPDERIGGNRSCLNHARPKVTRSGPRTIRHSPRSNFVTKPPARTR